MQCFHYYSMLVCFVISVTILTSVDGVEKARTLLRKRRYLAFPEGSTFVATLCATIETVTGFSIYYQGLNWGVAFTLPNQSSVECDVVKHKKRRRERRDMYSRIEIGLAECKFFESCAIVAIARNATDELECKKYDDSKRQASMGLEGRPCIYRALCEASRRFKIKSNKLSEELLRIIFNFPLQRISYDEPEDHRLYHRAYRKGKQEEQLECKNMFPECSVSLIDLALGDYSNNDNT